MSACKRLWRRTLDTPFLTHFSLLGIRCSPASATPAPRSPSGGHPLLPPMVTHHGPTRGRRSQASERHGANPTGGQWGAGGGAPVCTKMNSESGLLVHKGRGAHAPGFRVASGTAFTSPEPASGRRPRPQNPRFYPHVHGLPRRPESAAWLSHHPPPGPCHRRRDR